MNRRVPLYLALVLLAACQGSEPTTPSQVVPSLAISDGAHTAGNADFFFLPPMVWPTSSLSNWTRNGFNPSLSPSVEICPLNTAGTACATASGFPVVISGTAVKKHFPPVADPADQITGLPGDWAHYHAKWRMPNSCAVAIYRVFVKVGSTELGYADVKCVTRLLDLLKVDYKNFGAGLRGQDVQIPFRIERYALCEVPGVGPCGSASVLLTTATTTPLLDPGTGALIGSVTIPVQDVPSTTAPVVVNVEPCPDLRSRAVDPLDLPTFGPCLRITTDPEIDLSNAATVFICTIAGVAGGQNAGVASEEQEHRITLHRRDEGEGATVVALPHVVGCPVVTASLGQRLKGVLAALTGRRWNEAGNRIFDVMAPKPLYARRFIDQGGGGLTEEFSDFQFALPCALRVDDGNNQTGPPSSTLGDPAKARCVDLGGEGVNGARVNFAPGTGSGTAGSAMVLTTGGGYAETSWTLGAASGAQTLNASGFGLAGTDYNGPRCDAVDPFMVIQGAPTPPEFRGTSECGEESNDPSSPILLRTGSVTFNATSEYPGDPLPINYGSAGWSYQIDESPVGTWFSSPVSPFINIGSAPFRSAGSEVACPLNVAVVPASTVWLSAGSTDLRVRRSFALAAAGTVTIALAIDNDVQVFLDGVDISASNNQLQALVGGLIIHDGCPSLDSYTFTSSLAAGTHVLAIRAFDRGGEAYFDAKVTAP